MEFFKGLYSYEIIMLCVGALISIFLLLDLVIKIVKQKNYTKTIVAFIVPIMFIGFPSIQKISYDNGKIDIEKLTHDLSANPTDTTLRDQVQNKLGELKSRANNDPQTLIAIANAHWSLGNYDSCQVYAEKAVALAPDNPTVTNNVKLIQGKIDLHNNFKSAISKLNDELAKATTENADKKSIAVNIIGILDSLKKPQYVSQADLFTISKAYAALDQKSKAAQVADKAIQSDPNSEVAKKFDNNVARNELLNVKALVDSSHTAVKAISFDNNVISKRNLSVLKNINK